MNSSFINVRIKRAAVALISAALFTEMNYIDLCYIEMIETVVYLYIWMY